MQNSLDSPSRLSHRAIVTALAAIGCALATYLALYQLRITDRVFEPFFGDGSHHVLRSNPLVHLLPFPDALLGAIAYAAEATTAGLGDDQRWQTNPWLVVVFGLISAGLAITAILLVLMQAFIVHAWCTLCLCSAGLSIALGALAAPEVIAAVQWLRGTGRKVRAS